MKSFFKFLSEARSTPASEKAKKLGLTHDGSGGWKDRSGKTVARTVGGELKFTERGTSTLTTGSGQQPSQKQRQEVPQQKRVQPEEEPTAKKSGEEEEGEGGEKSGETVTLVFGRFNPPTVGHEKLLNGAQQVAADGDLRIYPSRSVDPKKNPLDTNQKTELMKKMFPDHADNIINDESIKTIFDALKVADQDGYSNVKIVVGSDRVAEFDNLAQKYNGNLYDFEEIDTISAGERDEDAEGVSGMSASKMRKAATENDFETFRQGIPDTLDDNAAKQMMNTVRKAMQVQTESWSLWEIAPKFDWKNLRENYVTGKIFKINQLVENLNTGLVGKIVRRGTNYLICVTEDDIMFKSWIRDLREYEQKKPDTRVGTTGYFKYAAKMTPGFDKGEKTNIQPGGKAYKGPKTNIKEFINRYKSRSL